MPDTSWKHYLADALYRCGGLRTVQALSRHFEFHPGRNRSRHLRRTTSAKYLILAFHRVGVGGVPIYCDLPKRTFEQQMQYIRRRYRILSLRDLSRELEDPRPGEQAVAVTFDDGYLGTYQEAFPILQQYGIPATVYLIGDAIENGSMPWYDQIFFALQRLDQATVTLDLDGPRLFRLNDPASRRQAATETVTYLRRIDNRERVRWCVRFAERFPIRDQDLKGWMMSWEQVRAMERAGISFGAHTMTHPVVSRLDAEALRTELESSKELIERRLQTEIEDFAFPFGQRADCGSAAAPVLRELGYRTAVTTVTGVNVAGQDRFKLYRFVVGEETSIAMFAYQLNRTFFEAGRAGDDAHDREDEFLTASSHA